MFKTIRHIIYYLDAYKLQNIYWEGLKFYTEADIKEIPLVKLCCCMYKNEEKSEKGNELLPYLPSWYVFEAGFSL